MRQTMIGLFALMTAMLISLNVQRASLSAKLDVIDNEMETLAGGVALEVLDVIGSKAFDEATKDGQTVTDPDDLTPSPFTPGQAYDAADDLDDFHHMQTLTLNEFDFDFSVDVEVFYVDEDDPEQPASSQTFAKRVEITVDNENLRNAVRLSHVFAYPD